MSWFMSVFIGVLSAAAGGVIGGFIGAACVEWYNVSSFEGGSGYFVIAFILLGLIVGVVCGIATSRVVAASVHPGALKALGLSLAILTGTGGTIAGAARLFADVPPTLNGQSLLLMVEVRWPASQTTSPAADSVPRALRLGAMSGNALRKSDLGPLWMQDARQEDGHWIVPGAVELFTNRGRRLISIEPEPPSAHGLLLPMTSPGEEHLQWSEWMPRPRPGSAPLPDGFTYRFKVLPRNQVVRSATVGPFEIGTIASGFSNASMNGTGYIIGARAEFSVRYRGQPVAFEVSSDSGNGASTSSEASQALTGTSGAASNATRMQSVATLPGTPTALLVQAATSDGTSSCHLLVDAGDHVETTFVSRCPGDLAVPPLTNDAGRRERASREQLVPGEIDRAHFMQPGTYLFSEALFDAGARTVHRFGDIQTPTLNPNVAPFGVSPNGRSFVQLGFTEYPESAPALVIIDTDARQSHLVPIDLAATRYAGYNAVDPDWLAHYYLWQRDANGHDTLVARTGVVPLPFRGVLLTGSDGNVTYHVEPAGQPMHDALARFLEEEFHAKRTPDDVSSYGYQTHIGDIRVHVFHNEHENQVAIFCDYGTDTTLVPRIAERFNAALATGKYDTLFNYAPHKQE